MLLKLPLHECNNCAYYPGNLLITTSSIFWDENINILNDSNITTQTLSEEYFVFTVFKHPSDVQSIYRWDMTIQYVNETQEMNHEEIELPWNVLAWQYNK